MTERSQLLHSWQEQVDPRHTALLMVDLQNDFVHPEGWVAQQAVPRFLLDSGIESVVDRSVELLGAARDAGVLPVYIRMIGDDVYLSDPLRVLYARNHGHERVTCVAEGTWGADWVDGLKPNGHDGGIVVDKHRYSSFIGTRLDLMLRANHIRTVVVCGVATSGCVESTIRDAFMLDYYVVIASDACGDYEQPRHSASLSKMALSCGVVVDVESIAKQWQADRPQR